MRLSILALRGVVVLAVATAGPHCMDISGDAIRRNPGAIPVGWSLPPEQLAARLVWAPAPSEICTSWPMGSNMVNAGKMNPPRADGQ